MEIINYKLIAIDLDGTLFNSEGIVSEENCKAIEKLACMGTEIVLSTGRTLCEIPDSLKNNPNISYIIGSNGSAVWDLKTGDTVISLSFNNAVFNKIVNILNKYDTNITFRYDGKGYVERCQWTDEKINYYHIAGAHLGVVTNYANYIDGVYDFAAKLDNIESCAIFFHTNDEMDACFNDLLETGDLLVAKAWDYNLEVFSKTSGKGNALKLLAERLNIKIEETIAVGDSDNDASMVKEAGLGLCVANGVESLKNTANEIICSNDEHVIDYILNHYF